MTLFRTQLEPEHRAIRERLVKRHKRGAALGWTRKTWRGAKNFIVMKITPIFLLLFIFCRATGQTGLPDVAIVSLTPELFDSSDVKKLNLGRIECICYYSKKQNFIKIDTIYAYSLYFNKYFKPFYDIEIQFGDIAIAHKYFYEQSQTIISEITTDYKASDTIFARTTFQKDGKTRSIKTKNFMDFKTYGHIDVQEDTFLYDKKNNLIKVVWYFEDTPKKGVRDSVITTLKYDSLSNLIEYWRRPSKTFSRGGSVTPFLLRNIYEYDKKNLKLNKVYRVNPLINEIKIIEEEYSVISDSISNNYTLDTYGINKDLFLYVKYKNKNIETKLWRSQFCQTNYRTDSKLPDNIVIVTEGEIIMYEFKYFTQNGLEID